VSGLSYWGYLRLVRASSAEGTVAEVSYHGVQDIFAYQGMCGMYQGMCGMYQGVCGIAGRDQGFRELVQGAGLIHLWNLGRNNLGRNNLGRNNMVVPGVVSFCGFGRNNMVVPGVVSFSGFGRGDIIVSVEGVVGRRRFFRAFLGRPLLGDILL